MGRLRPKHSQIHVVELCNSRQGNMVEKSCAANVKEENFMAFEGRQGIYSDRIQLYCVPSLMV